MRRRRNSGPAFLPQIQPNLHRIQEVNGTIDACQEAICRLMPAMDRSGRKRMLPFLLMSDGQKLLNRLAAIWEQQYLGSANPCTRIRWIWPPSWKHGTPATSSSGLAPAGRASCTASVRPSSGWPISSGACRNSAQPESQHWPGRPLIPGRRQDAAALVQLYKGGTRSPALYTYTRWGKSTKYFLQIMGNYGILAVPKLS